jgi:hypothetical protein
MKCSMISKCNLNRFLLYIFNVNIEKWCFLKLSFFKTTFLAYFIMVGPFIYLYTTATLKLRIKIQIVAKTNVT